jgi:hypothetical protein
MPRDGLLTKYHYLSAKEVVMLASSTTLLTSIVVSMACVLIIFDAMKRTTYNNILINCASCKGFTKTTFSSKTTIVSRDE